MRTSVLRKIHIITSPGFAFSTGFAGTSPLQRYSGNRKVRPTLAVNFSEGPSWNGVHIPPKDVDLLIANATPAHLGDSKTFQNEDSFFGFFRFRTVGYGPQLIGK
jgi:hypothetical protein